MSGSDASMDAEFDTVAAWTAEVVSGLAPAHRIPPACRGSGSPAALHWFLDQLQPQIGQTFLDCGAGIGGPAAFASQEAGVRALLTDPEPGACRAARALFDLPALRASTRLPIAPRAIEVGWSLGVLCTVDDQAAYLAEVERILARHGRFGMIVYCATHPGELREEQPEGNTFLTAEALDRLLDAASLRVVNSAWTDHFAAFPADWEKVAQAVEAELERRHANDSRWQAAQEQSARMGALLAAGEVRGRMLVLRRAG
jgi:SAM-dependent methyltransferase